MSRVVVTGGSGKLGRAVVEHLADHGYDVVNVDTVLPPADQPALFTRVDLTDLGQVTEALTGIDDRYDGVDAVVHLAAVPAPGLRPWTPPVGALPRAGRDRPATRATVRVLSLHHPLQPLKG